MPKITSILESISTQVFQSKTLQDGQQTMLKCLEEHNIKEEDKQSLIKGCMGCKSLIRLQQYLCNALLKFEGMSLSTKVK